jgi:hypothetical protein
VRRGRPLHVDPQKAAERRARREARRAAEQRPEDAAREIRDLARAGQRKPSQRRPDRGDAYEDATAKRYFREQVTAGGCVMCADCPPTREVRAAFGPDLRWIQAHHIISKNFLKRMGLAAHLWDVRNGLGLCAYHHERHERQHESVPFRLLQPTVFEFADEIGLRHHLDTDRRYARC